MNTELALWGWYVEGITGQDPEEEEPPVVQCHICLGPAYDLGEEIDCGNCGRIEL